MHVYFKKKYININDDELDELKNVFIYLEILYFSYITLYYFKTTFDVIIIIILFELDIRFFFSSYNLNEIIK